MSNNDDLGVLLKRTEELHRALDEHLAAASFDGSMHASFTLSTAQVAAEHGSSAVMLVAQGHLSSANAVLRSQFEATIRTGWLLYVASDEWIANYLDGARRNPLKDPGSSPSVDEMIRGIERKAGEGLAPAAVAPQLRLVKEVAWGPLNSFVHAGIHPTTMQIVGYTLDGAIGTVRNANALSVICAMFVSILSGDLELTKGMNRIQSSFMDCCPPPVPN